jgi:hypothetical protein
VRLPVHLERGHLGEYLATGLAAHHLRWGWKKPGFKKKKTAQWFFWGFMVLFWFFYIITQKREFLGFFSFKNTLGASRL